MLSAKTLNKTNKPKTQDTPASVNKEYNPSEISQIISLIRSVPQAQKTTMSKLITLVSYLAQIAEQERLFLGTGQVIKWMDLWFSNVMIADARYLEELAVEMSAKIQALIESAESAANAQSEELAESDRAAASLLAHRANMP